MNYSIKYKLKNNLHDSDYFNIDNRKIGTFLTVSFHKEISILRKLKTFYVKPYKGSPEVVTIYYDESNPTVFLYFHINWIEPANAQLEFDFEQGGK